MLPLLGRGAGSLSGGEVRPSGHSKMDTKGLDSHQSMDLQKYRRFVQSQYSDDLFDNLRKQPARSEREIQLCDRLWSAREAKKGAVSAKLSDLKFLREENNGEVERFEQYLLQAEHEHKHIAKVALEQQQSLYRLAANQQQRRQALSAYRRMQSLRRALQNKRKAFLLKVHQTDHNYKKATTYLLTSQKRHRQMIQRLQVGSSH